MMTNNQLIIDELKRVDGPVSLDYLEKTLGLTKRQVKETVWKMKEQELVDFNFVWEVGLVK